MKNLTNTFRYSFLIFLFITCFSCNEEEFLKEVPLAFFSPENSYVTSKDFESAITELYSRVRYCAYNSYSTSGSFPYWTSTDIAQDGRGQLNSSARFGGHSVYLVPTNKIVTTHWETWFKLVANANTIISRIDDAEMSDEEKIQVAAEAKFMRAFAYRYLVYLYGGVPLSLEEVTSPKTDFVRATKEEVLNQIILDATEAAENLPGIDEVVDGRVSNLVVQHLVAETYISLKEYDKAIEAATIVINDPSTSLMTERFGSMANQDPYDEYLNFTEPGDVYWDLFRVGNQNRSSGNTEALWVIQYEPDVMGGSLVSTGGWGRPGMSMRTESMNVLERVAGPVAWMTYKDPDGNEGSLGKPQSNYNSGGQGVSLMRNTDWFLNDLWESDWENDIRNAPHNIVRDYIYNNPNSAYYGMSSVEYPSPTWINQNWRWYPYPSKITTPGQHPDELFSDKENNFLSSLAGSTFRDNYMFRLAETYLLRAEAYLGKGDLINAAKDINVVRERAKATPVSSEDVTLDYILDERARELVYEEPRRITLHRTGKLVERVRKYNLLNKEEIQDYHGLWPIPYSFIEENTGAVIDQNPGY